MEPIYVFKRGTSPKRLDNVELAMNFLLIDWPSNFMDSSLHRAAQVAAMDALNGHIPAAAFRAAFVAAAREAGILAQTDDFPPPGS